MKQHPIPQNIMDVEFKLVGDLTLRQFIYLGIGLAIAYSAFLSKLSFLAKWSTIVFFSGTALALAFVPIHDRSLDVWLMNFFKAVFRPQRRVWRKANLPPEFLLKETRPLKTLARERPFLKEGKERLTKWLEETGPREEHPELEEKEKEFLAKLELEPPIPLKKEVEIEEKLKKEAPPLPALQKRTTEEKKETLATRINYSTQPVYTIYTADRSPTFSTAIQNIRVGRSLKEALPPTPPKPPLLYQAAPKPNFRPPLIKERKKELPETKPERAKRNEGHLSTIKKLISQLKTYHAKGPRPEPPLPKTVTPPVPVKRPAAKPPGLNLRQLFRRERQLPKKEEVRKEAQEPVTEEHPKKGFFDFLTPKVTNKPGEGVKPRPEPRGEAKEGRKTADIDFDKTITYYREQIRHLQEEKEGLSKKIETQGAVQPREAKERSKIQKEFHTQLEDLKKQNQELKKMIEATQHSLAQERQKEEQLTGKIGTYRRQLTEQETFLEALRKEKAVLSEKLKETEERTARIEGMKPEEEKKREEKETGETVKKIEIKEPKKVAEPSPLISDRPNVINGIVRAADGSLVGEAIVIVKDEKGEPVRALKTNNLGQFAISTPLPNGKYQVTVEKPGERFDIIEVAVTGTVLKPVILEGKE